MDSEFFLYVATHMPTREIYYYCGGHNSQQEWTYDILLATHFQTDKVLAPVRAGRKLVSTFDHRYVRVQA